MRFAVEQALVEGLPDFPGQAGDFSAGTCVHGKGYSTGCSETYSYRRNLGLDFWENGRFSRENLGKKRKWKKLKLDWIFKKGDGVLWQGDGQGILLRVAGPATSAVNKGTPDWRPANQIPPLPQAVPISTFRFHP